MQATFGEGGLSLESKEMELDPGGPLPVVGLEERQAELDSAREAVRLAAAGEGRVLCVEGPAGIGKTSVLEAVSELGSGAGLRALSFRGSVLEREFPFGGVRGLLDPVVRRTPPEERSKLFAGAARLAEPVLLGAGADLGPGDDAGFRSLHGLYWLVAELSDREPLLLAVDDAHWADRPSLRFLAYLARRLEGLPVLLAYSARTGEPGTGDDDALRELSLNASATLRPGPLSASAVWRLAERTFREQPSAGFVDACHRVTAGNPLFVRRLLLELREQDTRPSPEAARRLEEVGPTAVRQVLIARLAQLGDDAVALSEAVAVLGDRAAVRHAAELAELELSTAATAADLLTAVEIFRPDAELAFAHPIARQAVYDEIPIRRRAAMHDRAWRMLDAEGAEPERLAAHMLNADPAGDSRVVELLRKAAADAMARGAPEVAATQLERAFREPPADDLHPALLAELGRAEALSGRHGAVERLESALAVTPNPAERLAILADLGPMLIWSGRGSQAVALIDAEIDGAGAGLPRPLLLRLLASAPGTAVLSSEPPRVAQRFQRLRDELGPDGADDPAVLACLSLEQAQIGESSRRAVELARRSLESGLLAQLTSDSQEYRQPMTALFLSDRLGEAVAMIDEGLDDSRRRGSVVGFAIGSCLRAHVQFRAGALAEAEADVGRALELVREHELPMIGTLSRSFLIDILLETEGDEAAGRVLDEAGLREELPENYDFAWIHGSRGRLRLARGSYEAAFADLFECGRRHARVGVVNPAWTAWRSNAALALLGLERRDEARRLASEELELASRYGAPRAIAVARRVLGTVEGGDRGIDLLGEAVSVLEGSPAQLERVHALVALGAGLRRSNQRVESREPLREGLDLARRCGATTLAERAETELRATGARPRRAMLTGVDSLTPSELRVARLAASGMQNREIAQSLFVTVKTIETQLSSAYRKLEIGSRDELSGVLDGEPRGR